MEGGQEGGKGGRKGREGKGVVVVCSGYLI